MKVNRSKLPATLAGIASAAALIGGNAMAVGTDFGTITAGLDASTIATALVGAAVLLAIAGFAKWGAKKVGRFFG